MDDHRDGSYPHSTNENLMKHLSAIAVATASLLATGASWAQNGNMMNGGAWGSGWMGGYGGIWTPVLLVVVLAGVIAWIVSRKDK